MPIDVIVPRDSLAAENEAALVRDLTDSLLRWTDASDDDEIRATVGVFIHELPPSRINAGGKAAHLARVDVTLPPIALTTQERRQGFVAEATEAVHRAARSERPFAHVWVLISHTLDGGWGIDGHALTTAAMEGR